MARTAVIVASKPEPQTLGLDDLLQHLFPRVTTRDLMRLSCVSPSARLHEWWFQRRNGGHWTTPPGVPALSGARVATIVDANRDVPVRLSPLLYGSLSASGPAQATSLWVSVKIAPLANSKSTYGVAIDPTSKHEALTRLRSLKIAPSIILAEGFTLIAVWRLREPISDLVAVEKVNWGLARRLGADLSLAAPREMSLGIPGQPQPGVFPRALITAMLINDRAVEPEEIS